MQAHMTPVSCRQTSLACCRLVCQQCQATQLESNGLRGAIVSTHERIGSIAGLAVSVPYLTDTLPAPGSDSAPHCAKWLSCEHSGTVNHESAQTRWSML